MSKELAKKEDKQIQNIVNFFDNQGIIDFFNKNLNYPKEDIRRQAVSFVTKIATHDIEEKDEERKLTNTNALSKQRVFMSLLEWGLPTDERDLYYLYNKRGNLICEPSYKGLIYIASKNGLNVHAGLIFNGDEFSLSETAEGDSYSIKRKNPFARKMADVIGCYVYVENTLNGEKRVYTFSQEELEASRQASKKKMYGNESPAWKLFPLEMYLKSGVRKGIKYPLSKIATNKNISALFDDEMPEQEKFTPQSNKTADLSIEEEVPQIEVEAYPQVEVLEDEEKQKKFAELKKQFGTTAEEVIDD